MFWSGMTGRGSDNWEGRASALPRMTRMRTRGSASLPCVRRYRLTFRNVLRVRQGEEYAKWIVNRDGETSRDVRRRLIKAGYDGIRVEFHDGSAVEYVAFSNRSIRRIEEGE